MKRFLVTLVVLVLALLLAVGLALKFVDLGRYKGPVLAQVSTALGRELAVDGELQIELLPLPHLVANDVRLANAEWGSEPDMARIRRLEIEIELAPLLAQELRVNRILLLEPRLLLEKRADGAANWELTPVQPEEAPTESGGALPYAIDIEQVLIENGQFVYVDGLSGKHYDVGLARLGYEPTSEGARFRVQGRVRSVKVTATLDTLPIGELISQPAIPITLQAEAGDLALTAAGALNKPPATGLADLQLHLRAPDSQPLAKLLEQPLPQTGAVDVRARIRATEQGIDITDLLAVIGDSDLKGDGSIGLKGKRPRVTARLRSQTLDIASLVDREEISAPATGSSKPPSPARPAARVIPDDALPFELLQRADVTADLAIGRLQLPRTTLRDVNTRFELRSGRLRVEPAAALFRSGGRVTTRLDIDSRARPPRVRADFDARQFKLGDFKTFSEIVQGGETTLTLKLAGRGNTPAALAASLNGTMEATVGEGEILNKKLDLLGSNLALDLIHAVNPLSAREDTSRLRCAVARFDIKDGLATADRGVALETDKINMLSSGYIDLKNEQVEFNFRPEARRLLSVDLGELAKLVRLVGPLSDPVVEIDPKGTARLGVTVGAAVATAGTSYLAQRLWATTIGDVPACDVALGKAEPPKPVESTSKLVTKPVKAVGGGVKTGAEAVGSGVKGGAKVIGGGVKKIGSGIGKLFKGLGGKQETASPAATKEEEDE